jgi:hypothetical protein
MLRFWNSCFGGKRSPRFVRTKRPTYRPMLETFEERLVPSTVTVTSPADNGAVGTLRWAVNLANADAARGVSDTIVFANSVQQPISLTHGALELKAGKGFSGVTIDGKTRIDIGAGGASGVFVVDRGAYASLQGLGIAYGNASYGGGVLNFGQVLVNGCIFQSDIATYGGAVYNAPSATLIVSSSLFTYDHAYQQGGAIYNGGNTLMFNTSVTHNGANDGGGIMNWGSATLQNDVVDNNVVSHTGGGLYNGGSVSLDSCTFASNYATYGGAIGVFGSMDFSNCNFNQNAAGSYGGALFVGHGYLNSLHPGTKLSHYSGNTAHQGNPDSYVA